MSDIANKLKRVKFQRSIDSALNDDADGNAMTTELKSMDENDGTDLERSATRVRTRTLDQMRVDNSNKIKLAAIYDDEAEIIRILNSIKESRKGWFTVTSITVGPLLTNSPSRLRACLVHLLFIIPSLY